MQDVTPLPLLDKTLNETLGNPVFTLETTVAQTGAQIAWHAAGDLAWRYALYKLNPFVLSGSSATYAALNATGQLDLHAAASGEDESGLTAEWIADRAALARLRPLRRPAGWRTSTEAILRPCRPERQAPCGSPRHGRTDRRQMPFDKLRAVGFKQVPANVTAWSTPCSD